MRPLLLYIHGFNSSPLSQKAQEAKAYIEDHALAIEFLAPALPGCPIESYELLLSLVNQQVPRQIALIGSSLGGFMATLLAERFGLRAVLVNPAVRPHQLADALMGEHINPYSGEHFVLQQIHIEQLQQLHINTLSHPERLLLMVQTGDKTLDYRRAVSYYQRCRQIVEQGGDHRFQQFNKHLPAIFSFLELTS
jgi:predicted esterase YcpF (UPF0227 family)